ncbi:hypothetical protein Tco_0139407 [Tanacetum coccineum]
MEKVKGDIAVMVVDAVKKERESIRAELSMHVTNDVANIVPPQIDSFLRNYMSNHILHIKFEKPAPLVEPCRITVVRTRDHEDHHDDDALLKGESSAKKPNTSKHGTYTIGESSSSQEMNESTPSADPFLENDLEELTSRWLGLENYQHKVNLTAPTLTFLGIENEKLLTITSDPVVSLIYENIKKEKRVMSVKEIPKFCDAALKRVLEKVKKFNLDVKHDYVIRYIDFDDNELDGGLEFSYLDAINVDKSGLSHDEHFGVDDLDLNLDLNLNLNARRDTRTEELVEQGISQQVLYDVEGDGIVDKENEMIEPDVEVNLFGLTRNEAFDNIGITSELPDEFFQGDGVEVGNVVGFDSATGFEDEPGFERGRYLVMQQRIREIYANQLPVFTESQCSGSTSPSEAVGVGPSGSSGPVTRSKKRKSVGTIDAHDKGNLCPWVISLTKLRAKAKAEKEIVENICLFRSIKRRVYCLQKRSIDGPFMKGPFPCQVLAVVGLDPNNENYPLAYALVKAETTVDHGQGGSSVGPLQGGNVVAQAGPSSSVASESSPSRWARTRVVADRMSPNKTRSGQPYSQLLSQLVTEATHDHVVGRQMHDAIPTQSSQANESEWAFL